jgi:hypothetical protein
MGELINYAARADSIVDAVDEGPKLAKCDVKNSLRSAVK